MRLPTYVNILAHYNNKEEIVSAIIDLHPASIKRVTNQPNGFVAISTEEGWIHLNITFYELIDFYKKNGIYIEDSFLEEVKSYLKDNYGTSNKD